MDLKKWIKNIHENAVAHGWWDEPRTAGEIAALIHSELSEAVEAYRNGEEALWDNNGKPDGIAVEVADAAIRIMDYLGARNYTPKCEVNLESITPLEDMNVLGRINHIHNNISLANHYSIMDCRDDLDCGMLFVSIISCFELIISLGADPESIIALKHAYNVTRPYKHGKKC